MKKEGNKKKNIYCKNQEKRKEWINRDTEKMNKAGISKDVNCEGVNSNELERSKEGKKEEEKEERLRRWSKVGIRKE